MMGETLNIHSGRGIIARHGLVLPDLFSLCLEFYKEEKHQFNLSYEQKNQLAAYWRQSTIGPYTDAFSPGYFDIVGNDRKKAWVALGEISSNGAMAGFCNLLETACPALVPWIRHKKREKESAIIKGKEEAEKERKIREEEDRENSKLINLARKVEELAAAVAEKGEDEESEDEEMPGLETNIRQIKASEVEPPLSPDIENCSTAPDLPPDPLPTTNGIPEPLPTESAPAEPLPTESAPAEPLPTESAPAEPLPSGPEVSEPIPEAVPSEPIPALPVVEPVVEEGEDNVAELIPDESMLADKSFVTELTPVESVAAEIIPETVPVSEPVAEPVTAKPVAVVSPQAAEIVCDPVVEAVSEPEILPAEPETVTVAEPVPETVAEILPEEAAAETLTVVEPVCKPQPAEPSPEITPAEPVTEPSPVAAETAESAAPVSEIAEEPSDPSSTEVAAALDSAPVEQDPMALLMAQHYACVLHLQSLKSAGQVLTAEQEDYLVKMLVYQAELEKRQAVPVAEVPVEKAAPVEEVVEEVAASVEEVAAPVEEVAAPVEEVVAPIEEVAPVEAVVEGTPVVPETPIEAALEEATADVAEVAAEAPAESPIEEITVAVNLNEVPEAVVSVQEVLDVLNDVAPEPVTVVATVEQPVTIDEAVVDVSNDVTTVIASEGGEVDNAVIDVSNDNINLGKHVYDNLDSEGITIPSNSVEVSAMVQTLQNGIPDHDDTLTPDSDEGEGERVKMWSKSGVELFIAELKDDNESVLTVGRGETVTVRIPTFQSGNALYWEFATDTYDIGFGASFEWEEEDGVIKKEPILPILRRSSQEKVITGSHAYPRTGSYLLLFDNSYSLLRSKTVYYRVFYTH